MSRPPPIDARADRGTAARSGASDLALFAAVPAAFVGTDAHAFGARVDVHAAGSSTPATGNETVHQIGSGGVTARVAPLVLPSTESHRAAAPSDEHDVTSRGDAPTPPSHQAAHGSGIATYVPAPHHAFIPPAAHDASVSHASTAIDQSGAANEAAVAVMPADIAHALDTIKASAATLNGAIAALNDHLQPQAGALDGDVADTLGQANAVVEATLNHVGDLGAALQAGIAPIVTDADAAAAPLVADAAATVEHVVATADAIVAPVADTVADTAHAADAELQSTVADVGAATGPLLSDAATTVDHAAEAADAVVAPVVNTTVADTTHAADAVLDTTASSVADTLHDVGGGDPAGGITTLVNLVSAADAFNIHDDGPGASDAGLAPALGASGAVDLLADIHPADVLLGVTDHHDGGLGGVLHDDGHVLGLM